MNAIPRGVDVAGNYGVYPFNYTYTPASNSSTILIDGQFFISNLGGAKNGISCGIIALWNSSTILDSATFFTAEGETGLIGVPLTVPIKFKISNTTLTPYNFVITISNMTGYIGAATDTAYAVNMYGASGGADYGQVAYTNNNVLLVTANAGAYYNYQITSSVSNYLFSGVNSGYSITEYV